MWLHATELDAQDTSSLGQTFEYGLFCDILQIFNASKISKFRVLKRRQAVHYSHLSTLSSERNRKVKIQLRKFCCTFLINYCFTSDFLSCFMISYLTSARYCLGYIDADQRSHLSSELHHFYELDIMFTAAGLFIVDLCSHRI